MGRQRRLGQPRLCIMVTSAMTAETFLRGFLAYLSKQGWDVTLICSPSESVKAMAKTEGVGYEPLNMERNPNPFADLRSFLGLLRILHRVKPDAAWYATPKMSLLASLASLVTSVPVRIYQQWGLRLETTNGPARLVLSVLERLTALCSTAIVANSHSLAKVLAGLNLTSGKSVVVLGSGSSHGVDIARFSPDADIPKLDEATAQFLHDADGLTVGFVGRIHPDKGRPNAAGRDRACAWSRDRLQGSPCRPG